MARVVCLQNAPRFGEVERNLDLVEKQLEEVRADVLVLPELFATGYAFRDREECESFAEPFPGGPTIDRLRTWSERTGGMIVAGFAEKDGDRLYNAAAVVSEGQALASYRKLHLFGFEPEYFDAGDADPPVLAQGDLRVGIMVCFDWIFPETARCLAVAGADLIAHPSNLVLEWCQRAMPVRALENGVYTATANRVGTENRPPRPALRFTGRSQIVSPLGEVLVEAPASWETAIDAEIDAAAARDKSLPSGNDRMAERRPERYLSLVHRRRE